MSGLQQENDRQRVFAFALARGETITDAAKSVGYHYDYARRLAKRPAIRRLAKQLRDQVFDRWSGQVTGLGQRAIDRLTKLLGDQVPDQVAVQAIKLTFDVMLRMREAVETDAILHKIEERLRETAGGNTLGESANVF